MAQTLAIRLSRTDKSPWGFRLHGGKDFSAPLSILKVNGGSIAERAGLQAGDGVLKINNLDAALLRHKEAQDAIVHAGNGFELLIQRGGMRTWQPKVAPVGEVPTRPMPAAAEPMPVTQTSLAASPDQGYRIRSKTHNAQPTPFSPGTPIRPVQVDGAMKAIVNNQYNCPVGLYSEENIAETLSAQAEVLAGGVMGVNFKKNEKPFTGENSEVLKMVQQMDSEPHSHDHAHSEGVSDDGQHVRSHSPASRPGGLRSVAPPTPVAPASKSSEGASTDQSCCSDCGRLIVGVFVRVKNKNLHVECFKCATCGSSLKNVGYYSINDKLYCDIHARRVAVQYAPSADLEPIAVPPGAPAPSGAKPATFAPMPAARPTAQPAFSPKPAAAAPTSFSPRVTPKAPMLPPSPTVAAPPPSFASSLKHEQTSLGGINKAPGAMPFGASTASKVGPVPFHPLRPISHVQYPTMPSGNSTPPVGGVRLFPPAVQNQAASVMSASSEVVESTKSSQVVQEIKRMETSSYSSATSSVGTAGIGPNRVIWPPPRSEEEINASAQAGPAPAPAPAGGHHVSFAPMVEEQVYQPKEPSVKQVGSVGQTFARAPSAVAAPKPHMNHVPGGHFVIPDGLPGPGSKATGQKWSPKRGKGVLSQPGSRIPVCHACQSTIRGPFVTAMNKTWCPKDFVCSFPNCGRNLQDIGFVEEQESLVCENCWSGYLAPECDKCHTRIKAECMKAIGKFFHPACFSCAYCKAPFGHDYFYLEDGLPYCETDWNELFTTKCFGCGFPIGAGDHWVEALNNSYHTQCFKCSVCQKSLEGQGYVNKGGRPHCKAHAR